MRRTLEAIDALPSIGAFIKAPPAGSNATTDQAFQLWSRTDLARFRLTSAVELYAADGRLASRFALVPDYPETSHEAATCEWDIIDEASPFGSSERHILRASRAVCERGRRLGSVVVRAMLDYRTLPFISSRSPYLSSLGFDRAPAEGTAGRDLEFVMYGWSRAPLHISGTGAWPLPDPVFDRMIASREPLWATLSRDGDAFHVYFLNDRGGIYALGYPVVTWFGHLVNLAELVTLVGALYVVLLAATTLVTTFGPRTHAAGRTLLREVRSSFYRKLFLAFVAAAVVPVIVLALATRAYFAAQFRAEIQEGAVQTTSVAQRLLEDYATLQQRETGAVGSLDDQFMVLVGRAIDQSVNLFDRQRLQATSDRDLFASGLLSTRTPADVYRSIVLDRLPTFVGEEEAGGSRYLVAAAPVRAGGSEGIVTVPQTLQEQEVERRIDDLDRRVLFASVLFVLVGASLGYWMAERIADPVSRLTRATRRLARGDLDARVAAASADELGRLVQDFNRMAADLQRQRAELERTQRLEAWAEMARLVAHDIKNPLTPIQLSAEHARRVNFDRGRPLSPVLDDCVDAILKQVRLLRQISSEFSSFASSPATRFERTNLRALIDEVLEPYKTAIADRVSIEVQSSDDLPEVTIDRTLFARALTNVIENALHAMPGGGRLAIVASRGQAAVPPPAVSQERLVGGVVVQITDTGVGIDRESLAKIFEPYFSTKATGTGLGMTIAKRNVELNGGSIAIDSTPGAGTTVTITLPAE
jgi:signal transduction histidine kinase